MTDGQITLKCITCGHKTIFTTLTNDMAKVKDFCTVQICDKCDNLSPHNCFSIYRICPQCNSHDEYTLDDKICTNCEGSIINTKPTNPKDSLGSKEELTK